MLLTVCIRSLNLRHQIKEILKEILQIVQGYIWDANCIAHNHTLLRAAWSLICLGRQKQYIEKEGYVALTVRTT